MSSAILVTGWRLLRAWTLAAVVRMWAYKVELKVPRLYLAGNHTPALITQVSLQDITHTVMINITKSHHMCRNMYSMYAHIY